MEHEVKAVIAENPGLKVDDIASDASIIGDLGADSLNTAEMAMAIEGRFDRDIPDDAAAEIRTVQQAIDYIHHAIESLA